MAPRIRLNLSKPLPTISEAFEDVLEDIASNTKSFGNVYLSSDSCSGEEDYLQSVCQLARPTFLLPTESRHKTQDINKPGMLRNNYRVLNLSETPKMVSRYTLPNIMSLERQQFVFNYIKTYSSSDLGPLEELYTDAKMPHRQRCSESCENTSNDFSKDNFHGIGLVTCQEKMIEKQDLAILFPKLPSPRPQPTEVVCPELKNLKNHAKKQANEKENNLLIVDSKSMWLPLPKETPPGAKVLRLPRGQTNRKGEASSREHSVKFFHSDQMASGFDWLSGYQSAWKAAKMRACLLPAIAES